MSLLEVRGVSKRFGGVRALDDVSFDVEEGAVLGLIGPNGSGKTTLMNVLSGVYPPETGTIKFNGESLRGMDPHQRVQRGVSRTFQSTRVFQTVTVRQNMMVPVLHERSGRAGLAERAESLLELVRLSGRADQAASELSGGQQRLLEFARAMMTEPKIVLMDEPFSGVHPEIKRALTESIRKMQRQGASFVVVSHEIPVITALAEELICLATGRVIAHGRGDEVVKAPEVVEAYLGHRRTRRGEHDATG